MFMLEMKDLTEELYVSPMKVSETVSCLSESSNTVNVACMFLWVYEKETVPTLLSTGWFQEEIRKWYMVHVVINEFNNSALLSRVCSWYHILSCVAGLDETNAV